MEPNEVLNEQLSLNYNEKNALRKRRMSDKRLRKVRVSKVTTIEWKKERKCEVK